ncbi:hypothetical protein NL676_008291 [Syzygium grande]|nr:hypothetical protein NL676_008291 [Syzygium grande]
MLLLPSSLARAPYIEIQGKTLSEAVRALREDYGKGDKGQGSHYKAMRAAPGAFRWSGSLVIVPVCQVISHKRRAELSEALAGRVVSTSPIPRHREVSIDGPRRGTMPLAKAPLSLSPQPVEPLIDGPS